MTVSTRNHVNDAVHGFVSPYKELNLGLWSLFVGATIFLALRLWVKVTRRHGLWYDDHILIVSWAVLLANNTLIVYQFASGYILEDSTKKWSDRMHILINVSSCGTLVGQAWTKTAFGVTLLRMSNQWQRWVLWFCIVTMNLYMIAKVILQWAKVCNMADYDKWYRLNFCIGWTFREDFKEGGNVYNIIMDFVFAAFPWLITRSLEMRRAEKVGLCATMSLGMMFVLFAVDVLHGITDLCGSVAIVSAIRVAWKDNGNQRDEYYIYRNGLSQVWYSSEITGTIIVQCIPILRPIIRDIHTSLTSRRLVSTGDRQSTIFASNVKLSDRRTSTLLVDDEDSSTNRIALQEIPEETAADFKEHRHSISDEEAPKWKRDAQA